MTGPSRRRFLHRAALAAPGLALAGCGSATRESARPPNIVVLVTDDQRWDMLGAAGNRVIQTPHMDRLANEGVLFANHFVTTSLCAPSRTSIFTGLYASCHGTHGFATSMSDELHARSYPVRLRDAGYRTGFVGKYGIGRMLPAERFDYFDGFSGQGRYLHEVEGGQRHLTGMIGDKALDFLESSSADRPFCLSVSFKAPHVQDREPPFFINDAQYDALYRDVEIPEFKKLDPRYYESLPEFLKDGYEGRIRQQRRFPTPETWQEAMKRYYRLITGVDSQVDRIVEWLEQSGSAAETVIILTSDNGFFLGERGWAGKYFIHEESIRAPLIVHDPRVPGRNGRRVRQMTLNLDIAPTILDLAGLDFDPSTNGRSVVPLLDGESPAWRTDWFYEFLWEREGVPIPRTEGVRTERWKYNLYLDGQPGYEELYDLGADPQEEVNLASAAPHRDRLGQLRARHRQWKRALAAWRPDRRWVDPA